ncbi:hypothetical protein GmHk_18G053415 [Glycine max]|nr:hypothetical protein GmHk_18G053415 [Glycine max]
MKSELGGPIDIFFRNLGPHISLYKKPFGAPFVSLLQGFQVSTHTLSLYTTKCKLLTKKGRSIDSKMSKDSMRGSKKKLLCRRLGGIILNNKHCLTFFFAAHHIVDQHTLESSKP